MKRLIANIILLLSVLLLPFWTTLVLAVAFTLFFRKYYEVIVMLFISDLIFAVPQPNFYNIEFLSTILGVLIFVLISYIKTKSFILERI